MAKANVHEGTKKLNYSYTDDGNVKCSNHSGKQLRNVLKELNIILKYNPAGPLLVFYLRDMKINFHTEICT